MTYGRTEIEAELASVRATIKNIVESGVDKYGVTGGKTFEHLRLKDLESREQTLMARLAALNGSSGMTTIIPIRTRR